MNVKINAKSAIIIVGLILGIPSAILAYQSIERPWPNKKRVENHEIRLSGLEYNSIQQAYWTCVDALKKDPTNSFIRKQCEKLKKQLEKLEK